VSTVRAQIGLALMPGLEDRIDMQHIREMYLLSNVRYIALLHYCMLTNNVCIKLLLLKSFVSNSMFIYLLVKSVDCKPIDFMRTTVNELNVNRKEVRLR